MLLLDTATAVATSDGAKHKRLFTRSFSLPQYRSCYFSKFNYILSVPVTGEGDGGRPGDLRGGTVPRGELRVPRLEHDVPERGAPLLLALRVINPIV